MHRWDFIERVRRLVIPLLGLTARVTPEQYVGTLTGSVEDFERVLHEHGVIRNSLAYFKREPGGEWSVGSWVFLPEGFFGHFQEHVTVFKDGAFHIHREYNWRRHPIKHLREDHFSYPVAEWRLRLAEWGVGYRLPAE